MTATSAPGPAAAGDPVFAAFCAAGLWPGLGRRTAAELPAAGITAPDDVSADRLIKLPRVGRQRAERLFSSFLAARPTYEVVEMLVGAGLQAKLAAGVADTLGPDAGIVSPDDVTADRLVKIPKVGRQRAERLFSSFLSSQPTYDVVELLVGAGLEAKLAAGVADTLGPDAARRLRDDPWALLSLHGVGLGDADRLAIAILKGADRQDSRRGRAIVGLTLRTATRDGHTVMPADLVFAALQA